MGVEQRWGAVWRWSRLCLPGTSPGWMQTGDPSVSLSDDIAITSTFTAPGTPIVLTSTLTVTDVYGLVLRDR